MIDTFYRYFATAHAKVGSGRMEVDSHNVCVGVRHKF
jgi:hypothetical protein